MTEQGKPIGEPICQLVPGEGHSLLYCALPVYLGTDQALSHRIAQTSHALFEGEKIPMWQIQIADFYDALGEDKDTAHYRLRLRSQAPLDVVPKIRFTFPYESDPSGQVVIDLALPESIPPATCRDIGLKLVTAYTDAINDIYGHTTWGDVEVE